jgi:hypothetical protein
VNIHGPQTFIIAVVPFDQIAINFCYGTEARQVIRASGALQMDLSHLREIQFGQPLSKPQGVAFATLRERQIGKSRMLSRDAPSGLAVTSEINHGKNIRFRGRSAPNPFAVRAIPTKCLPASCVLPSVAGVSRKLSRCIPDECEDERMSRQLSRIPRIRGLPAI